MTRMMIACLTASIALSGCANFWGAPRKSETHQQATADAPPPPIFVTTHPNNPEQAKIEVAKLLERFPELSGRVQGHVLSTGEMLKVTGIQLEMQRTNISMFGSDCQVKYKTQAIPLNGAKPVLLKEHGNPPRLPQNDPRARD